MPKIEMEKSGKTATGNKRSLTERAKLNLVLFVAISIAVLFIHRFLFYSDIYDDVGAWGTFYTVFGVLYAIIAGFLIIEALSKYNKLQDIMQEEINNLQDIRDLAVYLLRCDGGIRQKIVSELKDYARSVATVEWQSMRQGSKQLNSDTTKEMYEIFQAIEGIEASSIKDEIALEILVHKMTDITTLRTKRISIATQKLPGSLHYLLSFMSWALIGGLMLLGVHSLTIHILMTLFLIIAVQLFNEIILDIDEPFEGVWHISPEEFQKFAERLENGQAEQALNVR
jgi:hypothetical protein